MKALILIALCISPCTLLADAREEARRDRERQERQREIRKQEEERARIRREEEKSRRAVRWIAS